MAELGSEVDVDQMEGEWRRGKKGEILDQD